MRGRIRKWCERNGRPAPETPGQFARTIFESLAVMYRLVLEDLATITGRKPARLHIVGGGSRNELLCRFAADACGIEVVAGPVEATALGNVLLQAIAAGRVADGAQARELVRRSFEPKRYEPQTDGRWAEAAGLVRG
jgi:rhamnulokinase